MTLQYDYPLDIATGRTRKETAWKNRNVLWSSFLDRISETHRTAETYAEYMAAKKDRQDEIKDIGGFVGGYLTGGRRNVASVQSRQLVSLDIDHGPLDIWDNFTLLYGNAAALYSTHKHCTSTPRYRLLLPLDRPVLSDEYVAIARRIAGVLGINYFDDSTYEASRLMYWPSSSKDGEYVFEFQDGPALSADEALSSYQNWRDASEWPFSSRHQERIRIGTAKQGDPLEKPGIVGAFCRTYNIHEAIAEYLNTVYTPDDTIDRYTYIMGSCSSGLVVYDGKYAYSHHGTDPVSGKQCNAFDLVRLHLFGLQDDNCKEDTPVNRRPSFLAMEELARKDEAVRLRMGRERTEDAREDFSTAYQEEKQSTAQDEPEGDEWLVKLDIDKKGNYLSTIDNIVLILENDPRLKGVFAFDDFEQREIIVKGLPWRTIDTGRYVTDADDANLSHYLERIYSLPLSVIKQERALTTVIQKNKVHPVREYLQGLQWDGDSRVDSVFIDYLGASDLPYTRAVTRKIMAAAVARVFCPGIKFDYALVLVGKQGIGKSTIIQRLGGKWFSDTFTTVEGKEAFEQLHGVWLVEMGELAGLRKAEVGTIKHFISKTIDRYRVAYGKKITNFPRQCVFFGTTNNGGFLRNDANGNRKFWPVPVYQRPPTRDIFDDLTTAEVGQIWAEAVYLFKRGESLHLSADLEAEANQVQADHTEQDERAGIIAKYLDEFLPETWDTWDMDSRRSFFTGADLNAEGTKLRTVVCVAEIWCELFGNRLKDLNSYNTKDIHAIMRNMPGWAPTKGLRRFGVYGSQRGYYRLDAPF